MNKIKLVTKLLILCVLLSGAEKTYANGGGYYNIWHVGLQLKNGENPYGYLVLSKWDVPSEAKNVLKRNKSVLERLKKKGPHLELLHDKPFSIKNIRRIDLEESLSIGRPEFFYIGNENSRRKIPLEDVVSFSNDSFQKPLVFSEYWPGTMPYYGIVFVEEKLYRNVSSQRKRDILAWGFGTHRGFKNFLISYDGYQPVNLAQVLLDRKFEDRDFLIKNGIIHINYYNPDGESSTNKMLQNH